jgi:hypothetical protein
MRTLIRECLDDEKKTEHIAHGANYGLKEILNKRLFCHTGWA